MGTGRRPRQCRIINNAAPGNGGGYSMPRRPLMPVRDQAAILILVACTGLVIFLLWPLI